MPSDDSDEFSNGEFDDSAFEESPNGSPARRKKEVPLSNDKYDLALNVSASMDDVSAATETSHASPEHERQY